MAINRELEKLDQSADEASFPFLGLLAGAASALLYTLASSFLRELSKEVDPAWVSAIKPVTTTGLFLPVLLILALKKKPLVASWKILGWLIFAGVFVQIAGNLAYQWSLGKIGLALVVPLTIGSMVACSAIGGRLFLSEKVRPVLVVALSVLVVSVFVIVQGGEKAAEAINELAQPGQWMFAALAACLAGLSFSVLGIAMRQSLVAGTPIATPMVITGICGLVILGGISFARMGWDVVTDTTPIQWRFLFAAAFSNTIAFLCLSYALKKLPVVYVHAINVSQVAMAAIVGLIIFAEPLSAWLCIGLPLMAVGFGLMSYAASKKTDSAGKVELPEVRDSNRQTKVAQMVNQEVNQK